ncbi:hypothetical protein MKW98_028955, partial [Papaver atlanticum]
KQQHNNLKCCILFESRIVWLLMNPLRNRHFYLSKRVGQRGRGNYRYAWIKGHEQRDVTSQSCLCKANRGRNSCSNDVGCDALVEVFCTEKGKSNKHSSTMLFAILLLTKGTIPFSDSKRL